MMMILEKSNYYSLHLREGGNRLWIAVMLKDTLLLKRNQSPRVEREEVSTESVINRFIPFEYL